MADADGQTALDAYDGGTDVPDDGCVYYAECGNTVPAANDICADCLDRLRAADREETY